MQSTHYTNSTHNTNHHNSTSNDLQPESPSPSTKTPTITTPFPHIHKTNLAIRILPSLHHGPTMGHSSHNIRHALYDMRFLPPGDVRTTHFLVTLSFGRPSEGTRTHRRVPVTRKGECGARRVNRTRLTLPTCWLKCVASGFLGKGSNVRVYFVSVWFR